MIILGRVARFLVTLMALLLACTTVAAEAPVPVLFSFLSQTSTLSTLAGSAPRVSWPIKINESVFLGANAAREVGFSTPDRASSYTLVLDSKTTHASGNVSRVGHLKEVSGYKVYVTHGPQGTVASIATPEATYRAEPANGVTTLTKVEDMRYPSENDTMEIVPTPAAKAALQNDALRQRTANSKPSPMSTIDLMVLYSPSTATKYGSSLQTELDFLVSVANANYNASGVPVNFRLVYSAPMPISDSLSISAALNSLGSSENATPADPGYDPNAANVLQLRNQHGADIVIFLRPMSPDALCGLATGAMGGNIPSPNLAYNVVENDIGCAAESFPHEIGHVMGLDHDRAHAPPPNADPIRAFDYSYGYGVEKVFGDIMSSAYLQAPSTNMFSDPTKTCSGQPCGITSSDPVNGADAVTSLNLTRDSVAAFRDTVVPLQPEQPQTGYYWNPAESGRGYFIQVLNNRVFVAAFYYLADGTATWSAAGPGPLANTDGMFSFSGLLQTYANGPVLGGTYMPASVSATLGTVNIQWSDTSHATMTWLGGTIPIERYNIVPGGLAAPVNGTPGPILGIWWNPTQGGIGYTMEVQSGTMFLAAYVYDAIGRPTWYLATGATVFQGIIFQGPYAAYAGGQTMGGTYQSPHVSNNEAGYVTIQFDQDIGGVGASNATMTFYSTPSTIQPFTF